MHDPLRPPTRRLLAAVVALALLVGTIALADAMGATARLRTPLGSLSPGELGAVALSMLAGGVIARERFAGIAAAAVAATGLASALAAWMLAPEGRAEAAAWLARHHGLGLVLEVGVAWLAARGGERLAARRRAGGA